MTIIERQIINLHVTNNLYSNDNKIAQRKIVRIPFQIVKNWLAVVLIKANVVSFHTQHCTAINYLAQ